MKIVMTVDDVNNIRSHKGYTTCVQQIVENVRVQVWRDVVIRIARRIDQISNCVNDEIDKNR